MRTNRIATCVALALSLAAPALAQERPEFPPFEEVTKGYEPVVSTADGSKGLYWLYIDRKKNQLLAELPPGFENQRIYVATSIAGGSPQTGWQWNDRYCYWKRQEDKLVLMEPNLQRQARGEKQDEELRSAVKRTYSDRVITSVKILTMGPSRGPVIDFDELFVKNSQMFSGIGGNASLATLGKVKAFPSNLELPVTMPGGNGELITLHFSISAIPKTDYKPRESDERIGYFLTVFKDLTKNEPDGTNFVRYINRWNLQKRDPSLKLSPPREPIVFYIEHTVPVRYRRYVAEGILEWNKAFEKCGVLNAVEVRQQDAQTGAYMDVDPEDVRYNYFRWITSETPFAMGPSRVNPETGEILDADIIFDDSMLKLYAMQYRRMIEAYGFDGMDPAALAWLEKNPAWNPLSRGREFNPVADAVMKDPALTDEQKADMLGLPRQMPAPGLHTRVVQQNFGCTYAIGKASQMRTGQLAMQLLDRFKVSEDTPMIDGVPEEYLGGILKEIVMHEVGHTLGLRHNFKASSWLTLAEYRDVPANQPNTGSVMDYNPIYLSPSAEGNRGQYVTTTLGPYDYWAIEYGYTLDDKRRGDLLKQVAQRPLQFSTDEDTGGPDPLVNRFDMGAEPLDWAKERFELVKQMRAKLLERAAGEGQSWHLLRQAYEQLLGEHLGSLRVASRYVGGVSIYRDRKGDPDGRDPVIPIEAARQRAAMEFVINNGLKDEAFDIRPEVLRKLATDKHLHWGNVGSFDYAFSIHDRVAQIQAFSLLYLMNPATLNRVYDNELRTPGNEDALTLPELMGAVTSEVYRELGTKLDGNTFTNRQPMISSLRRDLQSELTLRLIDLALTSRTSQPQPVQTLALHHLRELKGKLDVLAGKKGGGQIDEYTFAHIEDQRERVEKALDAVVNVR